MGEKRDGGRRFEGGEKRVVQLSETVRRLTTPGLPQGSIRVLPGLTPMREGLIVRRVEVTLEERTLRCPDDDGDPAPTSYFHLEFSLRRPVPWR